MINIYHYDLLAGNPGAWDEETINRCHVGSEPLTTIQVEQHKRGRRSAHLIKSAYGWTVRYASGLDDFRILRKGFELREDAITFGIAWANEKPDSREFFASKSDLP